MRPDTFLNWSLIMILLVALAVPIAPAAAEDDGSNACSAGISRLETVQAREPAGTLTRTVANAANDALEACGEPRAFMATIGPSTDHKAYVNILDGPTSDSYCMGGRGSIENDIYLAFSNPEYPAVSDPGFGSVQRAVEFASYSVEDYLARGLIVSMVAHERTRLGDNERVEYSGAIYILAVEYPAYVVYLDVYCDSNHEPCAVQTLLNHEGVERTLDSMYAIGRFNECESIGA